MPEDFAKLFHCEGIGQVLVTRDYDDEAGKDTVVFRIPDAYDARLAMTLSVASEETADKIFDGFTTAEQAAAAVKPLLEARDRILGQA